MKTRITFIELIIIVIIIAIVASIVIFPTIRAAGGLNIEYSEGQRTGVPYKISKKGVIWKTWEGELSLQLTTRDSEGRMVNQVFRYSVADDAVARDIEAAAAANEIVTLKYKQYLVRGFKYGSTDYNVESVERFKAAAH
jgi:flagellar basal body-associated protein FliL